MKSLDNSLRNIGIRFVLVLQLVLLPLPFPVLSNSVLAQDNPWDHPEAGHERSVPSSFNQQNRQVVDSKNIQQDPLSPLPYPFQLVPNDYKTVFSNGPKIVMSDGSGWSFFNGQVVITASDFDFQFELLPGVTTYNVIVTSGSKHLATLEVNVVDTASGRVEVKVLLPEGKESSPISITGALLDTTDGKTVTVGIRGLPRGQGGLVVFGAKGEGADKERSSAHILWYDMRGGPLAPATPQVSFNDQTQTLSWHFLANDPFATGGGSPGEVKNYTLIISGNGEGSEKGIKVLGSVTVSATTTEMNIQALLKEAGLEGKSGTFLISVVATGQTGLETWSRPQIVNVKAAEPPIISPPPVEPPVVTPPIVPPPVEPPTDTTPPVIPPQPPLVEVAEVTNTAEGIHLRISGGGNALRTYQVQIFREGIDKPVFSQQVMGYGGNSATNVGFSSVDAGSYQIHVTDITDPGRPFEVAVKSILVNPAPPVVTVLGAPSAKAELELKLGNQDRYSPEATYTVEDLQGNLLAEGLVSGLTDGKIVIPAEKTPQSAGEYSLKVIVSENGLSNEATVKVDVAPAVVEPTKIGPPKIQSTDPTVLQDSPVVIRITENYTAGGNYSVVLKGEGTNGTELVISVGGPAINGISASLDGETREITITGLGVGTHQIAIRNGDQESVIVEQVRVFQPAKISGPDKVEFPNPLTLHVDNMTPEGDYWLNIYSFLDEGLDGGSTLTWLTELLMANGLPTTFTLNGGRSITVTLSPEGDLSITGLSPGEYRVQVWDIVYGENTLRIAVLPPKPVVSPAISVPVGKDVAIKIDNSNQYLTIPATAHFSVTLGDKVLISYLSLTADGMLTIPKDKLKGLTGKVTLTVVVTQGVTDTKVSNSSPVEVTFLEPSLTEPVLGELPPHLKPGTTFGIPLSGIDPEADYTATLTDLLTGEVINNAAQVDKSDGKVMIQNIAFSGNYSLQIIATKGNEIQKTNPLTIPVEPADLSIRILDKDPTEKIQAGEKITFQIGNLTQYRGGANADKISVSVEGVPVPEYHNVLIPSDGKFTITVPSGLSEVNVSVTITDARGAFATEGVMLKVAELPPPPDGTELPAEVETNIALLKDTTKPASSRAQAAEDLGNYDYTNDPVVKEEATKALLGTLSENEKDLAVRAASATALGKMYQGDRTGAEKAGVIAGLKKVEKELIFADPESPLFPLLDVLLKKVLAAQAKITSPQMRSGVVLQNRHQEGDI